MTQAICNALRNLLLLAAFWSALPALAQQGEDGVVDDTLPATLVADSVFITPDRQLVAEGNVEAFQGQTRLRAERITFDRETGTLSIEGPIRIDDGGEMVILANAAEIDSDFQNGLLTGARMVLDEQLQMAALQMNRVSGRYTQLFKTAVTSCNVCEDGRPPLWQIRARKVIHDQEEKQLYFEDAQFRILDVPVMYLPRFRLPDPTLERGRGFLIPSLRTTSQLSTGVRLPYFIPLGDSRDLTLAPYISSRTRTLDYRYRQAFRRGRIGFEGAYTRDDIQPGDSRGYLFGYGAFDLPRDFALRFDLALVSDDSYLSQYDLPDLDRLRSEIALTRVKRDSAFQVDLIHYQSLRENDDETTPSRFADVFYERRYFPKAIGGELRLNFEGHGHERLSDVNIDGRDVLRATADIDWHRTWIAGNGLRTDWQMGVSGDIFKIYQDSDYPDDIIRATPRAALTLSYPMSKSMGNGVTQSLEPVVQLGWSDVHGENPPNIESRFVEFDQGNLLSLSRFPGPDRREEGAALVYGLNWARYAPSGWQAWATIGQVFRKTADEAFTDTSGLSGTSSSILIAGQFQHDSGLMLTGRGLIDNSLSMNKAEVRGSWSNNSLNLAGTYLWLGSDLEEDRDSPLSEVWFDGTYGINQSWSAGASLRYDISDHRATRAGFGVVYRNECVTVDLSLRRDYTSSSSVEPTTDFSFSISLAGFAVDSGTEKYRRSCS
ncbi:LPS-assembly protein LptD [Sedimentitalea todarodis]|uniref:LPS-assembly protein LptD n=1 Tax=Sedimentitalea todarodis TaxID=1631240 RepID=A0ABU3VC62_9RHOB|nr:LPS assembly protein LptD [Sedimentitalea todarodis]MDU9003772.1 LPS assembly protein LptD [Sedimentitalea todarodis]